MAERHGGRWWYWIGAAAAVALMAPASVQQSVIPSDAAAAIDAAVRADQGFTVNAAVTGAIAEHSAPVTAIQGARRRAGSATISSAVIDAISRYPGSLCLPLSSMRYRRHPAKETLPRGALVMRFRDSPVRLLRQRESLARPRHHPLGPLRR